MVVAVRDWTKFVRLEVTYAEADEGEASHRDIRRLDWSVDWRWVTHPALADPELPPPPPAPIDPAAAPAPPPDPFAPPPPADPLAPPAPAPVAFPPPADPFAPPPADPFAPPPADPLAAAEPTVIPEGTPAGQNPTPYTGQPVFAPPTFNPTNGSKAGAAKPIYINFQRPIADRAMAEQAIHISSVPPVPGGYWTSDSQVRWRPQDFSPAGTVVNVDAGGTSRALPFPSSWWPPSMTRRTR